ncbi:hypothetical protein CAPTEDRAFT_184398 [Capitella teleta]|uniref:Protein kinase domain-containing protein n=1 Tax=Capitella teleta TaxID=283909 RepID=R7V4A0_CAPTE|nr:hypothetical protein CAPTEDRAFT_184398 [Capitella teleta]|eukprot:ELU13287.1 hypothetical protein CAPTEDRAFT_184398 [Capitella teleta]
MSSADTESTRNSDSEDENEELVKEEEDTCPICLLEMVEGESLMECSSGCQNKLHHHCISIWFNECRRHNEPLICPLCRAAWKEDFIGDAPMVSVNGEASVDDQLDVPPNTRASSPHGSESDPDMMLPYADPIPPEHAETARLWIPVLGEEITSCLFSKNWAVREASLKHVSRLAQGALLLGVGAGRARVVLSSTRQAATRKMLECCCNVLAFMCADPVYKVFVAGLRTLRTVLSYTPCRDENQQTRLQRCMKSVVNTILWKCADSNKRTSQLSISALQELVKGQDGELGVGREIANPGTFDLGGVCYLLSCICQSFEVTSVQWQWLLGRFYMLDVLLDGNVSEFIIRPQEDGNYENYDRVFTILRFCVPAMNYGHQKVDRMARRVFYLLSKLQVQSTSIFKEIVDEILDDTNIHVQVYMRRKLLKVLSESQDGKEADGSPFITPIVSAASTPRCNSPVAASPPPPSWIPEAPPNTPNYKRMKSSHSAQTLAFSDLDAASALGLNVPCDASTPDASRMHKHSSMVVQVSDACTSPTLCIRGLPSPTESSDDSHPLARVSSQQDVGSQTESVAIRPSQLFGFTDESLYSEDKGVQTPDSLSEVGDELDIPIPGPDDDDFQPCASGNATYNTSASAFLTEDLSDLTLSPSGPEDKVSFKTEVASSPQTSAGSSQENCHCKEEIEKEEAEALAEALAKSTLKQDALPHVPGLSQTESQQETLTIRIHEEVSGIHGGDQPHQYQELVHWVRGPMLGTGAFSTCYQARDIKTGTLMAVKQISFCRNSLSEQEKVIEAVHEEIEMMARLNHPNVVRILGATQQGFHFFMFVEWMPGGSVALLLDKYGPFTEQVMINYTLQVLRGLAYLHDNHMLHRDLKGANLLVDSTGQRVRIGDFGASARLASRNTGAGEFQGQLLGTIAFMAPEVLRGESYGRSCDVWGIGCIVIEMATTKPPWGASDISNHLALIFKIASAERAPSIPECLSPPLRDLALRCLDPNREERPPARDLLKHPVFTMSR